MPKNVKSIPEGFHSATPSLTVRGADKALDFYKRAFGAVERMRMPGPGGKIVHAEIKIGDSIIFLSDEFAEMKGASRSPQTLGGASGGVCLYVADADAVFQQAVRAGAKPLMPLADMFWGDRFGSVTDPFGHIWAIATHKEDLTPEEIRKRQEAFFAQAAAKN